MRVIAIANNKGGVGKTTTTMNLGAALAKAGKRALLIDLDGQANLTDSLLRESPKLSIYDAFTEKVERLPIVNVDEGLDLVPASREMNIGEPKAIAVLTRLIERDKLPEDYDYILMDCPPRFGRVLYNALMAASGGDVFIVATPEAMPMKGIRWLNDLIEQTADSYEMPIHVTGVVITRWNYRKLNKMAEDWMRKVFGDRVFKTKIRENVALAEAPIKRQTIFQYAPSSNGAKDYAALAAEVIAREER